MAASILCWDREGESFWVASCSQKCDKARHDQKTSQLAGLADDARHAVGDGIPLFVTGWSWSARTAEADIMRRNGAVHGSNRGASGGVSG